MSVGGWALGPTGILTTHFWGPVANWGLVGSAVYDALNKGPEIISIPMTCTMVVYSGLFCRFALAVNPRNYLLFACHTFNVGAQLNQLRRALEYKMENEPNAAAEIKDLGIKAAVLGTGVVSSIAVSSPLQRAIVNSTTVPKAVRDFAGHPAGPFQIHFWAPTFKWALSLANLADIDRPTDKISLSQVSALTATGVIWSRYSTVITPVNYNLMFVNIALGSSSGYHLFRKLKADYFPSNSKEEREA
uniref:Mitochondrial pyruvate carrier n=1 Tax=Aureoumbra lagunensis TaxID=44058 RepID=A0A7S3NHB1_9STRA|mmetsp:Transcript_7737/g.10776  ORF Transcript_7737/g.10776 Transcript_7737/m.10776 type:complete len:246 (-) Transcript_7737:643-1380(-)